MTAPPYISSLLYIHTLSSFMFPTLHMSRKINHQTVFCRLNTKVRHSCRLGNRENGCYSKCRAKTVVFFISNLCKCLQTSSNSSINLDSFNMTNVMSMLFKVLSHFIKTFICYFLLSYVPSTKAVHKRVKKGNQIQIQIQILYSKIIITLLTWST
jgi:hypothetical protein